MGKNKDGKKVGESRVRCVGGYTVLIPANKKCTREKSMAGDMSFVSRFKNLQMLVNCQCIKSIIIWLKSSFFFNELF